MIVPVGLEVCQSVRQFFELGGQVEVPRPSRCPRPKEECGGLEPLRKNGKYPRQVIYWGMLFVMAILRFRCGKCGKTVSRPLGWLVPYKRFSAEMIAAGVEAYLEAETSYRKVSDAVSEPEFVEEKEDIRQTQLYSELSSKKALDAAATKRQWLASVTLHHISVGGLPVQASRIDYAAIAKGTCEAAEGPEGIAARGERQEPKQLQGADRDKSTEVGSSTSLV